MSGFDIAVGLAAAVAIVFGFRGGLLRSLATILGYICAAPLAMKVTPLISQTLQQAPDVSGQQNSLVFFGVFMAAGLAISVGLVAMTLVLVFDRIIPVGRDPAFLAGSHLRPLLSLAGQKSLKSLPPETAAFIDQMKSRRQI